MITRDDDGIMVAHRAYGFREKLMRGINASALYMERKWGCKDVNPALVTFSNPAVKEEGRMQYPRVQGRLGSRVGEGLRCPRVDA